MTDETQTPRTAALLARQFDEARKLKDGIPREDVAAAWIDLAMEIEAELAAANARLAGIVEVCACGEPLTLNVVHRNPEPCFYWQETPAPESSAHIPQPADGVVVPRQLLAECRDDVAECMGRESKPHRIRAYQEQLAAIDALLAAAQEPRK